jgi:hypothetical protein
MKAKPEPYKKFTVYFPMKHYKVLQKLAKQRTNATGEHASLGSTLRAVVLEAAR